MYISGLFFLIFDQEIILSLFDLSNKCRLYWDDFRFAENWHQLSVVTDCKHFNIRSQKLTLLLPLHPLYWIKLVNAELSKLTLLNKWRLPNSLPSSFNIPSSMLLFLFRLLSLALFLLSFIYLLLTFLPLLLFLWKFIFFLLLLQKTIKPLIFFLFLLKGCIQRKNIILYFPKLKF